MIGDEILVTVMEISGNTVRLGIAAPQGVSIFREEIWLAVKEETRAAAAAAADALPSGPMGEAPPDGPNVEPDALSSEPELPNVAPNVQSSEPELPTVAPDMPEANRDS